MKRYFIKSTKFLLGFFYISIISYSQKAHFEDYATPSLTKADTLHVILTGNKEIDAALHTGIDKYWTFCKVKYIGQDKYPDFKLTLGKYKYTPQANYVDPYNIKAYTRMNLTLKTKHSLQWGEDIYDLFFDDMTVLDTIKGIDINIDFIVARIPLYIKSMNAELKKRITMKNQKYSWYDPIILLKNKTILIQSEYFNNEITAFQLADLPVKFEIKKTSEIKQIFDNLKGNENLAQLIFVSYPSSLIWGVMDTAFIIDLVTGEVLFTRSYYKDPSGNPLSKKNYEEILKTLKKWTLKEFAKSN